MTSAGVKTLVENKNAISNRERCNRQIWRRGRLLFNEQRLRGGPIVTRCVPTACNLEHQRLWPMSKQFHFAKRSACTPSKKPAARPVWVLLGLAAVLLAAMTREAYGRPSP